MPLDFGLLGRGLVLEEIRFLPLLDEFTYWSRKGGALEQRAVLGLRGFVCVRSDDGHILSRRAQICGNVPYNLELFAPTFTPGFFPCISGIEPAS